MGSAATEVCDPFCCQNSVPCFVIVSFLHAMKADCVDHISTLRAMTPCLAMELLGFLPRHVICGKGGRH